MKKTSAALLALLTPLATHAADAVNLGTQTVTADFRNTDVQQLPEAVTVVDSEQIEARSAEHLEQILSFAPNVNFSSGSSRGRYYQIRGIGERSQFIDPVNPSVGLLIDGIDMTGLGAAATLFDVQQGGNSARPARHPFWRQRPGRHDQHYHRCAHHRDRRLCAR